MSPLPARMLSAGNFELGRPGCDNRIAAEAEEAGMRCELLKFVCYGVCGCVRTCVCFCVLIDFYKCA